MIDDHDDDFGDDELDPELRDRKPDALTVPDGKDSPEQTQAGLGGPR